MKPNGKKSSENGAGSGIKISDEIVAAIGMALHLHGADQHDMESKVLTFNRVAKVYSPWNSKIYGMQNQIAKNSRR